MIPIPTPDVEQALGRAALVYELQEVEKRLGDLTLDLYLRGPDQGAEDQPTEEIAAPLWARRRELVELLWPENPPPPAEHETPAQADLNFAAKVRELGPNELARAYGDALRWHPELTPLNDPEREGPDAVAGWLIAKSDRFTTAERANLAEARR